MRTRLHQHPCSRCGVRTDCDGDLERNHDGWPETICLLYHVSPAGDFLCEDCATALELARTLDEAHDA